MNVLDNYKTYIVGALLGVVTAVFTFGWIDRDTYEQLAGVLAALLALTGRHAVSKLQKSLEQK